MKRTKVGKNFQDTHLPQCKNALLRSHDATFDHDKVISDLSIAWETTLFEIENRMLISNSKKVTSRLDKN